MTAHGGQDWTGFAVVLGLLAMSLVAAWWDYRPARRWWRAAQARCQQLADEALDTDPADAPVVLAPVPDPESLDATRPEDIDVCPVCYGEGAVMEPVDPYADEWSSEECWLCNGTGVRTAA